MPSKETQDRKVLHHKAAVRTAVFYTIFAGLWIYLSDSLLSWFIKDPTLLTKAQTIKGSLFVAVTATLLYLYLRHCLQTLSNSEEKLESEREKGQQEAQEQVRQLNTLFDSMSAVVYVADLKTYELLYVNKFSKDFFGSDWQGQKCYHYLQEGMDQPCEFCTNPQLINNDKPGDPVVWEFLNTKNNRWYECFDKAIRWPDGRLVRLEVAQDITERKELAKIKDDLLSTMSHEMRTPLTAISGFAELLIDDESIPEAQKHHIDIIYKEAERLTDLINKFLDVRRLKIDRARVDYEHLLVKDLLEKAQIGTCDCNKDHIIQIDCQSGLNIYGNRKEMIQVMTQLLENACRYSPHGGNIVLTAKASEERATICVTDQGIGIPSHELESIFSPFHRLDTGDTRSTGGIGLGLCLAREIIFLHGGTMTVESTPGEGSTFTIHLPGIADEENHQDAATL